MRKMCLVALIAACGRQQGEPPKQQHERLDGEIAITLGDCAPPTTRFVSGPEPQAFTPDQLARPALYATMDPSGDVAAGFGEPTGAFAVQKATASAQYTPGTASPLVELRLALIDCFRDQDQHMGVAVVDLAPGSITAHGIANVDFTKCIRALAPQVKVKEPVRCSVAFGAALLPELPHIDLKPEGVFVGGDHVDVQESTDVWWKLEPIYTWSVNRVRTTLASTAPVTLHGPVVVRPAPTTPMKLVTKLVHTLVMAGDDPMLAADRSGVWLPLHPRNLPVVPVPLGTGGSWNSHKDKLEVQRISILVGKQQLWIDGKPAQDADLAAAEQRGPVEIAAQGEVPYSRVVEVIDKLGGTDWSLTSGRALTTPPERDQPHIERTTRQDVRGAPTSK